jgi:hypothetical protein
MLKRRLKAPAKRAIRITDSDGKSGYLRQTSCCPDGPIPPGNIQRVITGPYPVMCRGAGQQNSAGRAVNVWKLPFMEQDPSEAAHNAMTARLLRREALRRAATELNSTSGPGLEDVLGRISAEVTAEATDKRARNGREVIPEPAPAPRRSHPSTP